MSKGEYKMDDHINDEARFLSDSIHFQENNKETQQEAKDYFENVFQNLERRGYISDYKIVCDDTNNSPDVLKKNQLAIHVAAKRNAEAEFLFYPFIIQLAGPFVPEE